MASLVSTHMSPLLATGRDLSASISGSSVDVNSSSCTSGVDVHSLTSSSAGGFSSCGPGSCSTPLDSSAVTSLHRQRFPSTSDLDLSSPTCVDSSDELIGKLL